MSSTPPLLRPLRLCVFCGSNAGNRPDYAEAATALGAEMARRGIGLVYGGAKVGLMGAVADAVMAGGGEVIGVIPEALVERELAHGGLTRLEKVPTMHARKARMADLSSGFIALPGGLGTLEELFEVWTWAQLGHHTKPCALLDVAGFYSGLAGFLDTLVTEGFVREAHRTMLISESDPARLLDRVADYRPPTLVKWIRSGER
ncbi:TIGR00730 family Rossman fold protein [Segnochrobactraceae bacterium EtOH-i3]